MTYLALVILGALAAILAFVIACAGDDDAGASSNDAARGGDAVALAQAQDGDDSGGISVSGDATVTIDPDTAHISLGVSIVKPTAAEARDAASASMSALLDSVRSNGVSDDDIRTTAFNISPEYNYPSSGEPRIVGYRVTNTVSVKVTNLDSVPKVIDDAVDAVGDPIQVSGVTFTAENIDSTTSDARAEAMAEAKAKAKELAELAGVQLGSPSSITESSGGGPQPFYDYRIQAGGAAGEASTPIQAGQLDITVSVQVVYGIQ